MKKVEMKKLFWQNYELFRQKLRIREKKSNLYGLNGSLFFKLQQNNKISQNVSFSRIRKNDLSQKLLVYDILRKKY